MRKFRQRYLSGTEWKLRHPFAFETIPSKGKRYRPVLKLLLATLFRVGTAHASASHIMGIGRTLANNEKKVYWRMICLRFNDTVTASMRLSILTLLGFRLQIGTKQKNEYICFVQKENVKRVSGRQRTILFI